MILVLGGTSETAPVVERLADSGYAVLVSTATDLSLSLPDHNKIQRRSGMLDRDQLSTLITDRNIGLILDVTHPYAAEVSRNVREAARATDVPCLRLERPAVIEPGPNVTFAATHDDAAREACEQGEAILLTTGTRNLSPYVGEARRHEVELYARVLPVDSALEACTRAGIDADHQIRARGPFSVRDNRRQIRQNGIKVLVTKDSGEAGGTIEKIAAARQEGCQVVTIRRPDIPYETTCQTVNELVTEVIEHYPGSS